MREKRMSERGKVVEGATRQTELMGNEGLQAAETKKHRGRRKKSTILHGTHVLQSSFKFTGKMFV